MHGIRRFQMRINMVDETRSPGLEENFSKLEEIIDLLGDDELPLEEAFKAYSAGMAILKQCNDQIDKVEKQVLKLSEDGQLEVFGDGKAGF